jgi:hypothetical protein
VGKQRLNEAKSRGSRKGAIIRWVFDVGGAEEAGKLLNLSTEIVQGWLKGDGLPNEDQRTVLQTKAREIRISRTGATVSDPKERLRLLQERKKHSVNLNKTVTQPNVQMGAVLKDIVSRLERLESKVSRVDNIDQGVQALRESLKTLGV